ncbi:MAG: hypothetical protein ACI9XZ_004329, partial [Alphaproteobacteria bacterium]
VFAVSQASSHQSLVAHLGENNAKRPEDRYDPGPICNQSKWRVDTAPD